MTTSIPTEHTGDAERRAPEGCSVECPRLLTLHEVAELLGMSTRTIRRRVASGLIRKAELGGRMVRIPHTEVLRVLQGDFKPAQVLALRHPMT